MKIKTRCLKCKRVRYVTPIFENTPQERALIRKHYVCGDCERLMLRLEELKELTP